MTLRIFSLLDGGEFSLPNGSGNFPSVSLNPIGEASQFARNVNGDLVNLADPAFQKYSVSISASWTSLPDLFGVYPGLPVEIHCPIVIRERGNNPSRPAVAGSLVIRDAYIEYMPILACAITAINLDETDGEGEASWSITAEEL